MSITALKSPATKDSTSQEQFWKEHAVMQKASGLSRLAYCRKHQLNYHRFNYWFRKENHPIRALLPVRLNQAMEPLSPSNATTSGILCTLVLKNGGVLQIHDKGILPLILATVD